MKVILLGDSISEGIGTKKINYQNRLYELLKNKESEVEINNLAKTGSTIYDAIKSIDSIDSFKSDLIVIMIGSVDAQIRPDINKNKYYLKNITPSKYKNIGGMLDPRAVYSDSLFKKIIQKFDNLYRYIWKKILVNTQGTYQKVNLEDFSKKYEELLLKIKKMNCKVVCVSTMFLDDKYFLDSNEEYRKFNKNISELSQKYKYIYVDIFSDFERYVKREGWENLYYKDHFHPNLNGLNKIAENIVKQLYSN